MVPTLTGASNKTVFGNNLHKHGYSEQQRAGNSRPAQRRVSCITYIHLFITHFEQIIIIDQI